MKKNQNKTVYNTFNLWRRDESKQFTKRLAWFCACRAGRFSEILCNFISNEDLQSLCTYSIDYRVDDDFRELAYARQCLALFSKNTDIDYGQDKEKAFLQSFAETERRCGITNKRISSLYRSGELFFCEDGLVFDVARKITDILEDCPDVSDLDFRFGPGLNVGLSDATNTSARAKLDAVLTCSPNFGDELLEKLVAELPHLFLAHIEPERMVGKLSGVPKNAETYRSIIIEAILNTLVQLGIGTELKRRLRKVGIDLKNQYINRRAAYLGSINDDRATVDIRNASNTLALLVVFHLVQSEGWFNLLDQSRTSTVKYKEQLSFNLEMFSSMGNGFTFELESLVFYAISYVVVKRRGLDTSKISVFGDDIVVPTSHDFDVVHDLTKALSFFGFEVNTKKSYGSGPFRESCGCDYFLGVNIRPFYVKDRWCDARLIGLLNYDQQHLDLFSDIRLDLEIHLTKKGVNFGPAGYGDGHLHWRHYDPDGRLLLRRPKTLTRIGKNGEKTLLAPYYFLTVVKIPKRNTTPLEIGDLLYPLYSIYRKGHTKPQYVVTYDSTSQSKSCVFTEVNKTTPLEEDPYIVRNGWKTKVVKVPLFGI